MWEDVVGKKKLTPDLIPGRGISLTPYLWYDFDANGSRIRITIDPNLIVMKRVNLLMLLLVSVGLLLSCSKEDIDSPELMYSTAMSEKGVGNDGAPSGGHFNLNIIGVEKGRTADMTGDLEGHIYVGFEGLTKINLWEGTDFHVMDANGTDGAADFKLPNPDADGDGITSYSIWVRPLESVESASNSFCANADSSSASYNGEDGYFEVCTADPLSVESAGGSEPRVDDVSVQLLTIYVETEISYTNASGNEVTIPAGRHAIFDEIFEDYFWSYDTHGLRILQLRFYEIS